MYTLIQLSFDNVLFVVRLVSHDLSGYIHRVFVGNNEEVSRSSSSPSLSRTGDRVLDIIEQWMDRHQDDFLAQPLLQVSLPEPVV